MDAIEKKESPRDEFRCLLRARCTLIWVVTAEERRVERILASLSLGLGDGLGFAVRYWDCATGATGLDINDDGEAELVDIDLPNPPTSAQSVYKRIRSREGRELWILRDWDAIARDPVTIRGLKSLARDLQDDVVRDRHGAVVVLTPNPSVPESLRGSAVVLDWPLPERREIKSIMQDIFRGAGCDEETDEEAVIDAATGMAADDIATSFAVSIVRSRRIEPAAVRRMKKRVIDREPTLQWYEPEPRGLAAVGGLENMKRWLSERQAALSPEARDFGLEAPRGLLIAGIPGCGKSLTAKAVPAAWGLPLLRLDLGALRGSLVGQSEQAIRTALKTAAAIQPCVLWIDEIEKGLAGANSRGDSGVAADALGTILTWLQERHGSVFVVATANDPLALPPELTRKGRFDEVFWVDLPTPSERLEILETTLIARGRESQVDDLDLETVANKTDGFSGAEMAELVRTAMFRCFGEGKRPIETNDLLRAAEETTPLSRSQAEKIGGLRDWAKGRARRASPAEGPTRSAAPSGRRVLDLPDPPETETDSEEVR